ncbi:MAG TPA: LPS export ABC transporter periplasmic protein LptC [Gammaproteobacteria bacterium]|nr:LPS export ABC transporter periplasmic protein LptC [Gammaproteobacteria bacterium]
MNWRSLTGLLILVALAVATWWLLRDEQDSQPVASAQTETTPDYYFNDATITRLGDNGKTRLTLHATRIEHYPQPEYLSLENIRLLHVADDGTRWRVTAQHGTMPEEGKVITLRGEVHIERLQVKPRLTVDTPLLTLNTKTDMAMTDKSVIIHQGVNQLSGTGLTLWLNDSRIEMHSDVRGSYVQ